MNSGPSSNRQSEYLNRNDSMIVDEDARDAKKESQMYSKHYEVPNLSSVLYTYTHAEENKINQAFRIGNYTSIRDLPNQLLAGNVNLMSKSKQEQNLYRNQEERSYIELQKNGGYFSKFAW